MMMNPSHLNQKPMAYRDLLLFLDGVIKKTKILRGGREPCRPARVLRPSVPVAGHGNDLDQIYSINLLALVIIYVYVFENPHLKARRANHSAQLFKPGCGVCCDIRPPLPTVDLSLHSCCTPSLYSYVRHW